MLEVHGRLIDPAGHNFAGYQVVFSCNEKVKADGADRGEVLLRPTAQRAATVSDGNFALSLPDKNQLQEPIDVKVLAPDGEQLLMREISVDGLEQEIRIEVTAKTFFDTTPSADPFLGQLHKLTGRVLDRAGKRITASQQLMLWARFSYADEDEFEVVLVACTDAHGYFSVDYPRGSFAAAYGIVAGGEQEEIPIHLDDDAFPKYLILVAVIPEDDSHASATAPRAGTAARALFAGDTGISAGEAR